MLEQPQIIFSGTGTLGDLLPQLAIAAELQGRGHDCHVLGNANGEPAARALGVPFTVIAPAQSNNLTSVEENFDRIVFPSYLPTFAFFEQALARGRNVVAVNAENHAASTLVCERHQLPLCRITLTPFRMRSLIAPHWPWSEPLHGRLARTYQKHALPARYRRRETNPFIITNVNEQRSALGLAPLTTLAALDPLIQHRICLFPDWYCAPAPDWEGSFELVGFPLPPPQGALPARLEAFIERQGAPLVFTPGTGVTEVRALFEAATHTCLALDRPGVFLSPNLRGDAAHERLIHLEYVDLALLMPRAALLVHHGGIGTTARALEAGVPQIISPQAFDQPDNGHRIEQLGVGAVVERSALTGPTLLDAARRLLGDPATLSALAMYAERTRAEDAVARAADIIALRFASPAARVRLARAG
jgi:rhamnosyltransferase subunit B